ELAERMPQVGGQYAYLREAFHPAVGFLYGWALLIVINAGGTAAVAVTFGRYAAELTGLPLHEKTAAGAPPLLPAAASSPGGGDAHGLEDRRAPGAHRRRAPPPPASRAGAGGSARRTSRLRGIDGAGPVRLRRMADGELHRRGGARPTPQPSPGPGRRRSRGGPPLPRRQLGLPPAPRSP